MRARPTNRRSQEAALPGEGEERAGVRDRADLGRDHVGEHEPTVGLQLRPPERQSTRSSSSERYCRSELATTRSSEPSGRSDLSGARTVIRSFREALLQPLAHQRRGVAEVEPGAAGRDPVGRQRLAAAVVEHEPRQGRGRGRDVVGDQP